MKYPKKKNLLYSIILTLATLIVIGGIFTFLILKGNGSQTINVGKDINYKMNANATELQKEYFDELKALINDPASDPSVIAGSIVKNYIADFYTWTNKKGSFDVGGLQFIYAPNTLYIQTEAKAYFYKDLSYYINKYGSSDLLKVESVNIKYVDIEPNYVINDVEYPSYYVAAEWTYVPNSVFSPAEYQTKGYFSVMVRNGRYEIYRYYLE